MVINSHAINASLHKDLRDDPINDIAKSAKATTELELQLR